LIGHWCEGQRPRCWLRSAPSRSFGFSQGYGLEWRLLLRYIWAQPDWAVSFSPRKLKMVVSGMLKRKTLLVILSFLAVCSSAVAQTEKWDGLITDTHCGTNCQRTSHMTPDRACVRRCVKNGSPYGLWYKDHVYRLEPQSKAARFAAENVRVTGTLSGDSIHILSISRIPDSAVPDAK
jgi:hypothetical protein